MNKFKDLLISIFDSTARDSIIIGREDYKNGRLNLTDFTIKFTRINTNTDDKTYEKIKELIDETIKCIRQS